MKPKKTEYGAYFGQYIDLVNGDNLMEALVKSELLIDSFWNSISEEQACFRYSNDKWSIKELLQHIIDTERIFSFRALAFARGEAKPISGYDENEYTDNCFADERSFRSLVDELITVRTSTIQLFKSFNSEAIKNVGEASNSPLSARAAGFIIVGHELHHISVVKERYLSAL